MDQVREETQATLDRQVRLDQGDSKDCKEGLVNPGQLVQKELVEMLDFRVDRVLLDRLDHLAQWVKLDL